MEFIDHTGHIFSLTSYSSYPTGYEYKEFDYVFNVEDESAKRLSIGNYYVRPIRVYLHDMPELINISLDSSVFKLISSQKVQELLSESKELTFEIDEEDADTITSRLIKDDLIFIESDNEIITYFYVICYSEEEAYWRTNILIHCQYADEEGSYDEYCPISVGAAFVDENEPLIINGRNMGIDLPKDILKAVWGVNPFAATANEQIYNDKIKEYLLNYMTLRGECGNTRQAVNALKWFGWTDDLKLVKLVKTDNDIITQYIRDAINNPNDLLERFKHFKTTGLYSIFIDELRDTGVSQEQTFDDTRRFWGEGKPILENLFTKMTYESYDENDIKFWRPYFQHLFVEVEIKLAALRYFYKKYFLPMHSAVMSASISHQVHMNDLKLTSNSFVKITEEPVLLEKTRGTQKVTFPKEKIIYMFNQEAYVDDNFNQFTNYISDAETLNDDIYYINDNLVRIPILFESDTNYFNCKLVLERLDNLLMYESSFSFYQTEESQYDSLIIYPRAINNRNLANYWMDKSYVLHLNVNGVWYDYNFEIKFPELHLETGSLSYQYREDLFKQINKITEDEVDFNSFMYLPYLIDVNNINFPQNVIDYINDDQLNKFLKMYQEHPSIVSQETGGRVADKYYNQVHYYKLIEKNTGKQLPFVEYEETVDPFGNVSYDQVQSEIVDLYKVFFNEADGSVKDKYLNVINANAFIHYDFYLMHDDPNIKSYEGILSEEELREWQPSWYIVLISKETVDKRGSNDDLIHPEFPFSQLDSYRIEYFASDTKWLINRMIYNASNGVKHFKKDDIICGTVNNIELPFILEAGSKWVISPFSLGMSTISDVTSTTNAFLMSLSDGTSGYEPGYYKVTARFSLDGQIQYQRELYTSILVEN